MRFSLVHADAVLATLDADPSEKVIAGSLSLIPGSSYLEETVHEAWRAMSNYGFLPPSGQFVGGVNERGDREGKAALTRLAALEAALEWRDEEGNTVELEMASLFGSGRIGDPIQAMLVLPGGFKGE